LKKQPHTRDYFSELYVAGILGDSGWNVYFPKRDVGFDFIITKLVDNGIVIRPVQVKGLYPTTGKTHHPQYGFTGKLSQLHSEMVLAIAFFPVDRKSKSPKCVAYMPCIQIRPKKSGGFTCFPTQFKDDQIIPRRDFQKFFDENGIRLMESKNWKNEQIGNGSD
jgi:hypothetical protein